MDDYHVFRSQDLPEIIRWVNEAKKDGYQVVGAVQVHQGPHGEATYLQAVEKTPSFQPAYVSHPRFVTLPEEPHDGGGEQ